MCGWTFKDGDDTIDAPPNPSKDRFSSTKQWTPRSYTNFLQYDSETSIKWLALEGWLKNTIKLKKSLPHSSIYGRNC